MDVEEVIKVIEDREAWRDWPPWSRLIHDVWFDADMSPRATFAALVQQIQPLKDALSDLWARSRSSVLDPTRPGFAIVSSVRTPTGTSTHRRRFLGDREARHSGSASLPPFRASDFEELARASPGSYLFIRACSPLPRSYHHALLTPLADPDGETCQNFSYEMRRLYGGMCGPGAVLSRLEGSRLKPPKDAVVSPRRRRESTVERGKKSAVESPSKCARIDGGPSTPASTSTVLDRLSPPTSSPQRKPRHPNEEVHTRSASNMSLYLSSRSNANTSKMLATAALPPSPPDSPPSRRLHLSNMERSISPRPDSGQRSATWPASSISTTSPSEQPDAPPPRRKRWQPFRRVSRCRLDSYGPLRSS